MEKRRTVPVKLDVDRADAALLEATIDEFLWAANYVTRHAFDGEYITTSKTTLHDDTFFNERTAPAMSEWSE
jgi:PhoPQ-activated pathogenicity-related protein